MTRQSLHRRSTAASTSPTHCPIKYASVAVTEAVTRQTTILHISIIKPNHSTHPSPRHHVVAQLAVDLTPLTSELASTSPTHRPIKYTSAAITTAVTTPPQKKEQGDVLNASSQSM
jgi:hypothetical protein